MLPTRTKAHARASVTRAFTMIELIAVIVVMGIVATVAIPSLSRVTDARAASAARALYQHTAFARECAVNLGSRTWVVFDTASGSCAVLAEPEGGTGYSDARPLTDPRTGRPLALTLGSGEYAGVGIVSASPGQPGVVGFDWLGSPLDAAGVALVEDGSVTLTNGTVLRIRAYTGALALERP